MSNDRACAEHSATVVRYKLATHIIKISSRTNRMHHESEVVNTKDNQAL